MATIYRFSPVSARENEVLECVLLGRLSKQLAIESAISPKTVEVHHSRIMMKLEVDSLAPVVAFDEQAFGAYRERAKADA